MTSIMSVTLSCLPGYNGSVSQATSSSENIAGMLLLSKEVFLEAC